MNPLGILRHAHVAKTIPQCLKTLTKVSFSKQLTQISALTSVRTFKLKPLKPLDDVLCIACFYPTLKMLLL